MHKFLFTWDFWKDFFTSMPLSLMLGLIWFLSGFIIILIVYPILYNFFVIPKIEKRVGKKLEYGTPLYILCSNYFWIFGGKSLAKYLDLIPYIFIQYINWKFRVNRKIDPWSCLFKVGYDIRKASKLEIVTTLLWYIYGLFLFILSLIVWYLMHHGH